MIREMVSAACVAVGTVALCGVAFVAAGSTARAALVVGPTPTPIIEAKGSCDYYSGQCNESDTDKCDVKCPTTSNRDNCVCGK